MGSRKFTEMKEQLSTLRSLLKDVINLQLSCRIREMKKRAVIFDIPLYREANLIQKSENLLEELYNDDLLVLVTEEEKISSILEHATVLETEHDDLSLLTKLNEQVIISFQAQQQLEKHIVMMREEATFT